MTSPGPYSSISAGSLPITRHLEVAAAGDVPLGQRDVVVAERLVEGAGPLVRRCGPASCRPSCPRRDGLTISRGSPPPAANASSCASTPSRSAAQRPARTSTQSVTGSPSPRASRLNSALSMPTALAVTPEPVYASPAASHSAWAVPSSPNGPWSARKTSGGRVRPASDSRAVAAGTGPVGAQRGGVVVVGLRPAVAPEAVGQPPPGAAEVDQPGLGRVAGRGEGVADRRPRDDRHVVLRRRTAQHHHDGRRGGIVGDGRRGHQAISSGSRVGVPVARELDLERELDAVTGEDLRASVLRDGAHVGGGSARVVDDEVGVLLGHDRAADTVSLEAQVVDQPTRGVPLRVPEHGARRRDPQRLVLAAPAADVVERAP